MNERMMERRASPPGHQTASPFNFSQSTLARRPPLHYTFNFFRTNSMITA